MTQTLPRRADGARLRVCGAMVCGLMVAAQAADVVAPAASSPAINTVAGMPVVVDARNLYSETGPANLQPALREHLERIYVPNLRSNDVYVIDPSAMKIVDKFKVGIGPQHVVPSWDLQTLWVANNAERRPDGSLTPVDPRTGKPRQAIRVDDPCNRAPRRPPDSSSSRGTMRACAPDYMTETDQPPTAARATTNTGDIRA